jgi:long-chain acyl-CoA synthetase
MNFLEDILGRLKDGDGGGRTLLLEPGGSGPISVNGMQLLALVDQAREFLKSQRLSRGDRVALLASNSIEWVAMDLAIMAEGQIVVPLYARQAAAELIAMMKDCSPSLICCGDRALRDAIVSDWPGAPPQVSFEQIFSAATPAGNSGHPFLNPSDLDPVTIIYTSGTSGEAKGVVLTYGNVTHMLGCTSARLDQLMQGAAGHDQVFHYLPFCFAGSWIMLMTCLMRQNQLTINSDLSKLAEQMRAAKPDYFLNVPQLLERMRKAVDEQLWKAGGVALAMYRRAKAAYLRHREGKSGFADRLWLRLANVLVFPAIRKKMIGPQLRALICGSAPLNVETQQFFMMLGIAVLQVYGLTETTAICTMDDPANVEPGRVGPAIGGIEMKLGEEQEIIVRGPNIFPGYWKRPQETAKALRNGWFHTGDQGEINANGNWKITGRIKNLIILGSGHNIAPEAIEEDVLTRIPGTPQVVIVGNGRGYLSAIITGAASGGQVQAALDEVNAGLPHYKQVRAFHIVAEPFTIENGLLTANGKLKRDLIAQRYQSEIEAMYATKQTA